MVADLAGVAFGGLVFLLIAVSIWPWQAKQLRSFPEALRKRLRAKLRLAGVSVRQMEGADHGRLREIFQTLEGRFFPHGYSGEFESWLHSQTGERYVVLLDGRVVGCAGLLIVGLRDAHLSYALVDSGLHRRGLGCLLLAARIAALPPVDSHWVVTLMATDFSLPYYSSLQFRTLQSMEENGGRLFHCAAVVENGEIAKIRALLEHKKLTPPPPVAAVIIPGLGGVQSAGIDLEVNP